MSTTDPTSPVDPSGDTPSLPESNPAPAAAAAPEPTPPAEPVAAAAAEPIVEAPVAPAGTPSSTTVTPS
ncbi:MAG: hypothetical protein AB7L76_23655, partial [Burkholderiaceae bacterium]